MVGAGGEMRWEVPPLPSLRILYGEELKWWSKEGVYSCLRCSHSANPVWCYKNQEGAGGLELIEAAEEDFEPGSLTCLKKGGRSEKFEGREHWESERFLAL